MVTINLTKLDSIHWPETQKKDLKKIIDLKSPIIPPNYNEKEIKLLVQKYIKVIKSKTKDFNGTFILAISNQDLCFTKMIINELENDDKDWIFMYPVIKHIKIKENNKTFIKKEFVRWRTLI